MKSVVTVPVAVKLAPWLTAPGELAARLVGAGAGGLVLFNRFMQPDIDIQQLSIVSRPQLSSPWEARLPMTWIALLRGRTSASLAATTGVAGPGDVVKYLLAGADVVMTASGVLRSGPAFVRTLNDGLRDWMVEHGYDNVAAVRGLLQEELAGDARVQARRLPRVHRRGRAGVRMTTTDASIGCTAPLDPAELAQIDAWWRAANYLSVGQIYLLGEPAAAGAAAARARQAAPARPLGHDARAEPAVCAPQSR